MAFMIGEQRHLLETRVLHTKLNGPISSLECLEDLGLLQEVVVDGRCRSERRSTSVGSDLPVEQSQDLASHVVVEWERRVCVDSVSLLPGHLKEG